MSMVRRVLAHACERTADHPRRHASAWDRLATSPQRPSLPRLLSTPRCPAQPQVRPTDMAVGTVTSSLSVEDSKQVQDVQEVQEVEGMVLCGLSAGAARWPLHYQGLQPRAVMLHYCLN